MMGKRASQARRTKPVLNSAILFTRSGLTKDSTPSGKMATSSPCLSSSSARFMPEPEAAPPLMEMGKAPAHL